MYQRKRNTGLVFFLSFLCVISYSTQVPGEPDHQENDRGSVEESEIPEKTKKQIQKALRSLGSPSYDKRTAAMETLRNIGDPAVPFLVKRIDDSNPEVQNRAVQLLEELGHWDKIPGKIEERTSRFLKLLKEKSYVKSRKLVSAMLLRDKGRKEKFLNHLKEEDLPAGNVQNLFITPFLKQVFKKAASLSSQDALKNLCFLLRYGKTEEVLPVLKKLLKHSNKEVRIEALKTAAHVPDTSIIPTLIDALTESSEKIRYHAFFSLNHLVERKLQFNAWWNENRRQKKQQEIKHWWKKNREHVKLKGSSD